MDMWSGNCKHPKHTHLVVVRTALSGEAGPMYVLCSCGWNSNSATMDEGKVLINQHLTSEVGR